MSSPAFTETHVIADFVMCSDRDWQRGAGNRIAQKHIDFVVTRIASSRIVAAIELDDCTHRRPTRHSRDDFLNSLFRQLRIQLVRVPASWNYDIGAVADHLLGAGLLTRISPVVETKKPGP